ncbi:DUF1552 domain-containing protein [Alienimonas chondri]|uniref:DUF1552 domain-containing protein n=1 Tax=Alienimonas chondri TaxID=2681879 RepID=A0ABX1VDM4_9PLAN|nr:DUF1552 domain-containing protein [Alienimonas chondri]NNJ25804.1 hypothetical protein [Alienimonas chondri]
MFDHLPRRTFLRGAGVAMALPLLERFAPGALLSSDVRGPGRMVCLCATLGLHQPLFTPEGTGHDYKLSPYLEPLARHKRDFTVFSGLSHPEVDGGHSSEASFLTAAPNPASSNFRNSISLDQYALDHLNPDTRFPHLTLGIAGPSLSWTRAGVQIPAQSSPSQLFEALFLDGSAEQKRARTDAIADGRSVLDLVAARAKRLQDRSPAGDRRTLDQYFTSVRELEQRMQASEAWVDKPKPQVDYAPPTDVKDRSDFVAKQSLMYDMMRLALQTDSTRVITLMLSGNNLVPALDGIEVDWHNLSHHGKDPEKIEQLRRIELEEMNLLAGFLDSLADTEEAGGRLLDRTLVLFGSNLGNASMHDTRNMPMLLAGGSALGMKHAGHLAFDADDHPPLCNLHVSMLQALGVETDTFASGTGTLTGLEVRI